MGQFWPRSLQFMWPFLWLLLPHCCIFPWHGWSSGNIVERYFRRLWTSTASSSTASHSQGLMQPILAIRACRSWLCEACGSTSRVAFFSPAEVFFLSAICGLQTFIGLYQCSDRMDVLSTVRALSHINFVVFSQLLGVELPRGVASIFVVTCKIWYTSHFR